MSHGVFDKIEIWMQIAHCNTCKGHLSFVRHALPHLGRHEVSERDCCQGIQAGADRAVGNKVKTRERLKIWNLSDPEKTPAMKRPGRPGMSPAT